MNSTFKVTDAVSTLSGYEFVIPYVEAAFGKREQPWPLRIFISSTDVYGAGTGENLDETTPVNPQSEALKAEKEFLDSCAADSAKGIIFRCPNVVGTGMGDFPRYLVQSIYRGFLFHIPENEATLSSVHAAGIALAAKQAMENPQMFDHAQVFNITDGCEHSFRDFADALAYRLDNRRISTLRSRWQIWLYKLFVGRANYDKFTGTLTFSNKKFAELGFGDQPDVCQYLRTHVYDENSL